MKSANKFKNRGQCQTIISWRSLGTQKKQGLLTEETDADKLDAATGKRGFFAKMLTSEIAIGGRDTEYFQHSARFITLFGRFVTEVLEA